MRSSLLLIFYLCSIASYSQTSDELIIRNILERQKTDWNKGDVEAFMVGYWENDSLMYVGKSGVTYGYKQTLNTYKKNYADTAAMGKLQFTIIKVSRLSDEYYHVTGKWYLTRSIGDASGHFTLLFRKINDQWVIISDHSS